MKSTTNRHTLVEEIGDESTIHGLRFLLCERHRRRRPFFLIWALVVLLCTGATFWHVGSSIYQYYQFDVKTTTSTEIADVNNVDFPALTFENENRLRKSAVSGSRGTLEGLVPSAAGHVDEISELLNATLAACYDPSRNDSWSRELDRGYAFWRERGFVVVASLVCPDSESDVRRCWWQDRSIDCSNLFFNHMCDNGWCYTFNPHREIVHQNVVGKHPIATAYGVEAANYSQFPLTAAGPRNGLRLLINLNHDDYCLTRKPMAGYKVVVHNSRIQPMFFLESPILLSPGVEASVTIRLNKFTKKTESIGRCAHFKFLDMQPNSTVYFREACYLQSIAEHLVRKCNCYPLYAPLLSFSLIDKLLKGQIIFCWGNTTVRCTQTQERYILEKGVGTLFDAAECPAACEETKYTTQVTFAYFPSLHVAEAYAREYGFASVEKFRENYLMVEFYVESLVVLTVEEVRDMEIIDLISSIGGIIGFYLGMSIVSILEIVEMLTLLAWPILAHTPRGEVEAEPEPERKRKTSRQIVKPGGFAVDGQPPRRATRGVLRLRNHPFLNYGHTTVDEDGKRWYFGNYGFV